MNMNELEWIREQPLDYTEDWLYFFKNRCDEHPHESSYHGTFVDSIVSIRKDIMEIQGEHYDGCYHWPLGSWYDEEGYKPISNDKSLWRHVRMDVVTYDEYVEYINIWKKHYE